MGTDLVRRIRAGALSFDRSGAETEAWQRYDASHAIIEVALRRI
jgi:hypothetical protein